MEAISVLLRSGENAVGDALRDARSLVIGDEVFRDSCGTRACRRPYEGFLPRLAWYQYCHQQRNVEPPLGF